MTKPMVQRKIIGDNIPLASQRNDIKDSSRIIKRKWGANDAQEQLYEDFSRSWDIEKLIHKKNRTK